MKAIIILGDGMSDRPVVRLGGKTPLQVAQKPHIDRIARAGRVGLFRTIEPGWPLGSDVANLSVLGYNPIGTVQGRAVLEAAAMGVELADDDVAFRCNVITLNGDEIKNHSAGHIDTASATELIRALDQALGGGRGDRPVTFHPGVSFRHLLVLRGGWAVPDVRCAPPHDNVGGRVDDLLATPTTDTPAARASTSSTGRRYRSSPCTQSTRRGAPLARTRPTRSGCGPPVVGRRCQRSRSALACAARSSRRSICCAASAATPA
jgi:2,3-bisphosphoglycerate-independent phosphoglycerate mutase